MSIENVNLDNISLERIEGIYDIQVLTPAVISGVELLLGIILLLSLTSYLFWRVFYSRKGIAKRQIKKLQNLYHEKGIAEHDAIYQLCSHLQTGLKLKHLKTDTALPEKLTAYSNKWLSFTKNISTLRYKTNIEHELKLDTIFMDSLFWLKVWP